MRVQRAVAWGAGLRAGAIAGVADQLMAMLGAQVPLSSTIARLILALACGLLLAAAARLLPARALVLGAGALFGAALWLLPDVFLSPFLFGLILALAYLELSFRERRRGLLRRHVLRYVRKERRSRDDRRGLPVPAS